jgi:hypothetical protein
MIRYSEYGQPYDDGTGPEYGPEDQQYIEYMGSDEYGNYGTMRRANPNYNYDKYATPDQRAFDSSSRGSRGLRGAIDRVGRTVENNLIQPLAPYVNSAVERFGNAAGKYGPPLAALAISGGTAAEFLPGTLASLSAPNAVTGLGELGINTALPAGVEGGIAAGSTLAGGAAPSVANALIPAAATAATNGLSQYIPAALGAAAQVAGGAMANRSITDAANTAAASSDKNLAFQRDMFNTIRADQEPFRAAGVSALGKLTPLMDYKKFSMDDFVKDPGYNFRFTEGQRGLDASAAARGGLQSGSALKAATRYGQEMGSQEYNNAFNRYGIERDRALNPLMTVAGYGQTAANNLQPGTQNFGNPAGQIMQNAGDTQANSNLARGSVYANTGNNWARLITEFGNRRV